ncbi:MAG TPA: extensin family protein [Xanthobacteraceae bacterium]|nr:extensin family protein [Xanthobacteraceae bacterium]
MARGVRWYLVSSLVLVALIAVAGCSHYMLAEREPWRAEAELSCLNSGAVKESAARVRISSIDGPGACGMVYPLRVSALGGSSALGYDDESMRPPSSIPNNAGPHGSAPQNWPGQGYGQTNGAPYAPASSSSAIQSSALPPVQRSGPQYNPYQQSAAPQSYPPQSYPAQQPYPSSEAYSQTYRAPQTMAQVGQPLSLNPPGLPEPDDDEDIGIPGGPPHPYYGGPNYDGSNYGGPNAAPYSPRQMPTQPPPLGPPDASSMTASIQPVAVEPAATLACPIVSALDQWITGAVQPAALRWFRQPVVEIKQISAYSCRGMNGNPNAHISEHAFGNALDVAEFDLADGHKVSVQYGWHGSPEEQGFLHDVQSAACDEFTTVLAPGANVYHYNHIHVDLMRHYNGRHICEPSAIPGEVAAARVRSRFAAQHDPNVTGSIKERTHGRASGYSGEDDNSPPDAVPGED